MDKIIEIFLKEPSREYYVREIAKRTGKSPTTASKHLKKWIKKKILIGEKKYNHLLFRVNTESRQYKLIKINYNMELLEICGLIEYLEEFYEKPHAIVLFGSFARGEDNENSDIDILVISSKKEIAANLEKFKKILGREIQLFIHSPAEIKKMTKENPALLNSWANGIVLRGFLEVVK